MHPITRIMGTLEQEKNCVLFKGVYIGEAPLLEQIQWNRSQTGGGGGGYGKVYVLV